VEGEQTEEAGASDAVLRLRLRPRWRSGGQRRQTDVVCKWLRQGVRQWRRLPVRGRSARISSMCTGQWRRTLRATDWMSFQRLLHSQGPQRTSVHTPVHFLRAIAECFARLSYRLAVRLSV